MLKWQKGLYPTDGIWGIHWYDNVMNSNTFKMKQPKIMIFILKMKYTKNVITIIIECLILLYEK